MNTRELVIPYKAKEIRQGKWIYGTIIGEVLKDDSCVFYIVDNYNHPGFLSPVRNIGHMCFEKFEMVDYETICRHIVGKNFDVYENDIIEISIKGEKYIGIIKFGDYGYDYGVGDYGAYIKWVKQDDRHPFRDDIGYWFNYTEILLNDGFAKEDIEEDNFQIKVVGNIFDNPELIEEN